jgi:hypothetical protein
VPHILRSSREIPLPAARTEQREPDQNTTGQTQQREADGLQVQDTGSVERRSVKEQMSSFLLKYVPDAVH